MRNLETYAQNYRREHGGISSLLYRKWELFQCLIESFQVRFYYPSLSLQVLDALKRIRINWIMTGIPPSSENDALRPPTTGPMAEVR